MYVPRHFSWPELSEAGAFVDAAAAADLITFDGTRPVATRLPVIWERPTSISSDNGGGYGRLLGHLALANDQWQTAAPGAAALVVVNGPEAYVSPSWYESTRQHGRTVPTWNYESVQLSGPVAFHRDADWLRDLVTRLTHRHEDGRARPWAVTDAPAAYIDGQLRAIVGVEVTVTAVGAKRKLSQNRSEADQAGVVAGLHGEPGPGPAAIAGLMSARLPPD